MHNNADYTVDVSNINITKHALQRARERFNLGNEKEALNFFRNVLINAKFICEHKCNAGHTRLLYAFGRTAVYMDTNKKTIVTVNRHENVTYEPIKNIAHEIHAKEIRKITRKQRAKNRSLENIELELRVELAELELRKYRTRSNAVKISCDARISAIHKYLDELKSEIDQLENEKRRIARSMVAVM